MPKARSARRNHRIRIESPTESQSDTGAVTAAWATVCTCWASVTPLVGRELIHAEQMDAVSPVSVEMRYVSGITPKCRIIFKGRTLSINSIQNIDERSRELRIFCSEDV